MLASNFRFSFVVRLLQAISTVRHRHGESTAQTAGRLWSLRRPAEPPEPQLHGRMIAKKKNPGETLMDHVERIRERAETTGTPLCCTRWRQRIQRSPRQMNVVFFLIYVVFVGRLGLLPKKKERTFFTRLARKWLQKAAVSETPVEFSSRGFSWRRLLSHPRPPYSGANVDFFSDVLTSTCSVRQPGAVNYAAAWKYSSAISSTPLFYFFLFSPKIRFYSKDNNTCSMLKSI